MHIEALEVRKFLGNIHAVLPHIENKRIFSRLVNALTRNFFWDGEKLRHEGKKLMEYALDITGSSLLVAPRGIEPRSPG